MVTRREFHQLILAASLAAVMPARAAAAETGVLDERTRLVLVANAKAITGFSALRGYYEDYYRHQALNRAGHLFVYRLYARMTDRIASETGAATFLACTDAERLAAIAKIRALPRAAQLFEGPIFQETLAVFEKTDAWLQLGYESWPGTPRGHDIYQRPI